MADFEITAALEGHSFPWESKKIQTTGGKIVFWLHPPTQLETAMSHTWAGLSQNEKGEAVLNGDHHETILAAELQAKIHIHLASLCIDRVEGFDRWPEESHEKVSHTLERLTPAAMDALKLGPKKSSLLLEEIGEHLLGMYLDDKLKKSSEPQSTGQDSRPSTQDDTQTIAASAPTPTSEKSGNVTEGQSPSMTSGASESQPVPSP